MDKRLFATCGRALYGRTWKSQVSDDLEVTRQVVHNWAGNNDREVPDKVRPAILQRLRENRKQIDAAIRKLEQEIDNDRSE